jgi:hypothetical protein
MKIAPDKKLFWFLKGGIKLDLSDPAQLDMYIQQVITAGRSEDIRMLLKNIGLSSFKSAFPRLKHFLPSEVRKFWEDALGDNQQGSESDTSPSFATGPHKSLFSG